MSLSRYEVRTSIAVLILLATGACWTLTVDRMHGMDAGPGTDLGGLGWFVAGWALMMAAMMLPSLLPAALTYAGIRKPDRDRRVISTFATTGLFIGGYLAVWVAVGALAYAVVGGVRSLDLVFLGWDKGGAYVAGGVIVLAALYELTPLKRTCLRHCRRSELLERSWHPGPIGALRMGAEHGGFCIGCCWALMAALLAVGVMSAGWMVFFAVVIAFEKLLPRGLPPSVAIAPVLVVLGIGVAFAASDVPGLTVPGSPAAERSMDAMGIDRGDDSIDPMTDKEEMR